MPVSPSNSLATLRPDLARSLEQFDLAMDRQGFIGLKMCPVIEALEPFGNWGKIPLESLLTTPETRRGADGAYLRDDWDFQTATYGTVEHGREARVDDKQAALYRNYFDQERISLARGEDQVLRNQELRIANLLVGDNSPWIADSFTTSPDTAWTDHSNATPLDDMVAWKKLVWGNCGLWPNAFAMSRLRFLDLQRSAQIIDQVKYSGLQNPSTDKITVEAIAALFDIQFLFVAGSAQNAANPAQSRSISPLWPEASGFLGRVAQTEDPAEPCVARTFHWAEDGSTIGGTVEAYRDESRRSDILRCRHQVGEQVYYEQCGYALTGL